MLNLLTVFTLLAGLFCTEGVHLEASQLKAGQDSEARWDDISHQWVIRLTCGSFMFQGHPPLNVTWTTPSGEARFSSGYESGRFFLNLNAPVQGGKYTCAIPSHHLPELCDDAKVACPSGDDVYSSVDVDEVNSKLALVEAKQNSLQEMVQHVQELHEQDMRNVTQVFQGIQLSVQEQREALENLKEELEEKEPEVDLSGPCREGMYNVLADDWRDSGNSRKRRAYYDSYYDSYDYSYDYSYDSYDYSYESYDYDDYQCDRDLPYGWYRFYLHGQNAVMPTHCVEKYKCKTHAPQWLDLQGQNLPGVGQEVKARACANWDYDCCRWESPVTVRNCGNFFVYYLQPGDVCHLAYCAEPQN